MTTANAKTVKLIPTASAAGRNFDPKQVRNAVLMIEISEYRFRCCLIEEATRHCIWLEDFASETFLSADQVLENIRLLLFDHPVLSSDAWKQIRILVNSHAFTLIPDSLFRKEYVSHYLRLALGRPLLEGEKIVFHRLHASNAVNVFLMPLKWWEYLQDHFALRSVEFFHNTGAVIGGAAAGATASSRRLTANIEEDHLTLVFFKGEALQFCNKFRYLNAQEATFFILSCLNQLNYLPEEVSLVLSGEITPFSDIYLELSRFLPDIRFADKPSQLTYIPEFEDLADHRYFALLNTIGLTPSL